MHLYRERVNKKLQKIKPTFFLEISKVLTQSNRNDLKVRISLIIHDGCIVCNVVNTSVAIIYLLMLVEKLL